MEILAVIPARGGSKGIIGKNIRLFNGRPLIYYTINEAIKSRYISRVVVSTEDKNIADIAKQCGCEVPFLRPKELATDKSPTIDAIIHCIDKLKQNEGYIPDYTCVLQCTSPLRTVEHIDGTIQTLIKSGMDGAVSVCEAEVNPYWTNVFVGDRLKYFIPKGKKILRRQDLPKVYRINGVVYAVKTTTLIKERSLEVENMTGYIMNSEDSVDIDTMLDFEYAEMIMRERDNLCEGLL